MTQPISTTFVSIDIETTGLDEDTCQILEIGAVIDDWVDPMGHPPTFHCYVKQNMYKGQAYALSVHPKIFRRIATLEEGFDYFYPGEAAKAFGEWLKDCGAYQPDPDNPEREMRAVVAGKNFASFDDKFLRKLPHFDENIKYHHRIIDPAMLFWNPLIDTKPPGLRTCMERAGMTGEVAHTALEDAIMVSKMIHVAVGRMVKPDSLSRFLIDRKHRQIEESHSRVLD